MFKKVVAIIAFSSFVLVAQGATRISGTVINTVTNQPVAGARVLLGEPGLADTTDAHGAFLFDDGITSILRSNAHPGFAAGVNFPLLAPGKLVFEVKTASMVSLVVRSLNGRTIYRFEKRYQPGTYALPQPGRAAGMYFCQLNIGNDRYTLKQLSLGSDNGGVFSLMRGGISVGRQSSSEVAAAGAYSNTILVTHQGYLSESVPLRPLSVLTGLVIKMQPDSVPDVQPNPDTLPGISGKPVKVYIMMGQSNMVGMGMVTSNSSRWNPADFFLKDKPDTSRGGTVFVYSGTYSSSVNYDTMVPIDTTIVKVLGGIAPPAFPGAGMKVLRGFWEHNVPGIWQFTVGYEGPSTNAIMKINGVEVYRKDVGQAAAVQTPFTVTAGTRYPYSITFETSSASGLGWMTLMNIPGSLKTMVEKDKKFPWLENAQGEWTIRKDVWYKGVVTATADKWLSPGCGAGPNQIGPELGFGTVLGNHHAEPVLLLKASQGNRSLGWDFLPPGSKRWTYGHTMYCGYGDSVMSWPDSQTYEQQTKVAWYAGFEYDECTKAAHAVLDNFGTNFPQWKTQGYQIAGFVWWQGHKDGGDNAHTYRYEFNMVNMIKTLRAEFKAPNAPFVLATVGFNGWAIGVNHKLIAEAQLAVSGEKGNYPEFAGNVRTMEARDFWREKSISPGDQDYHYNLNAETYYLVGDALGRAMVSILPK